MTEHKRHPVTIYDVAKAAGVAPSTVSRTFARPGRVNAETAERIRQIAEKLGYRTNPVGQAPSTNRTHLLGLMVADVANPFHAQLTRGAQVAATEAGYELLLADSRESGVRERAALERLVPVVEGFIIGVSRLPDAALRTIAKQRPMVVLNRELRGVPSLVMDNAAGIRAAIDHLAQLGHESITYAAGPEASFADGVRFRALRDHGASIGIHTHKIGPFLPTFEGGLMAAEAMRERPPTAVIAYNDLMAVGVLHGLARAGLRVPEQVSVVGFDDILISRLCSPTLTTVFSPSRQMGITAVGNIVAMIKGAKPAASEALVMPVQLKVRESTGQRRRKRVSPALGTTMVSGSSS